MATISRLAVELSLIDRLSSGLDGTRSKLKGWGDSLTAIGQRATVGLTLPILTGFTKLTNAASDLNEAQSATTTIYGESSKEILAWSKTTANAYGVTSTAALDAVNVYGQIFKGVGVSTDAAGKMGSALVDAAGDLSSFYNAVPTQVMADLQSGIVGQYEPLLKYGIVLNEATVSQKAMEMTGKTLESQLTNQDKIMARHTLIVEGLGDAEGDAARTANGLANMKRRLTARGADLAAKWGQVLLPAALKFLNAAMRLLDWLEKVSPAMQKLVIIVLSVAAALGPLLIIVGQMLPALSLLLGPLGLIVLALGALGAAYATNLFGFRDALNAVAEEAKYFFNAMMAVFRSGTRVSDVVERFPGPLQGVARGFLLIADAVGDVVSRFQTGGFRAMLDYLPTALGQVWNGLQSIGGALVDVAIDTAVSITGWLWEHRGDIWSGIKAAVGWTTDTFSDAITATINGGIELADGFLDLPWGDYADTVLRNAETAFGRVPWGSIWDSVTSFATGLWEKFQNFDYNNAGFIVGQGLRSAIEAIGPTLVTLAGDLLTFFWDGLQANWQTILRWFALWPILIPAAIVGAAVVLGPKAWEFLKGFLDGLGLNWDTQVVPWFTALPGRALDAIGDLTTTAYQKGVDILQGFWDGLVAQWISVGAWFAGRDDSAKEYIGDLSTTLYSKGTALIEGLWDGAGESWDSFTGWLEGRGAAIASFVGDLSEVLWAAGRDAIQGLINGAQSKIPGLQEMVNTAIAIFRQIPLLGNSPWPMMIEAGQDAMDGLAIGAESRMRRLDATVGRAIGIFAESVAAGAFSASGGAFGSGGSGGAVYVTIQPGAIVVNEAEHGERTADIVLGKFAREAGLTWG